MKIENIKQLTEEILFNELKNMREIKGSSIDKLICDIGNQMNIGNRSALIKRTVGNYFIKSMGKNGFSSSGFDTYESRFDSNEVECFFRHIVNGLLFEIYCEEINELIDTYLTKQEQLSLVKKSYAISNHLFKRCNES